MIFLAAIAIRLPLLFVPGFPADQTQFVHWAYLTKAQGLAAVYAKQPNGRYFCNYPPGYILVLRGLAEFQDAIAPPGAKLTDSTAANIWNRTADESAKYAIRLHKMPALFADALLATVLFLCLRERLSKTTACVVAGVYAISPAVLHDSCVWGQVDSIHTLLLVLSVEAARRRRVTWMSLCATMAMLFKAQSIILLPLWAAVGWICLQGRPRELVKTLAAIVVPVVVLLMPFFDALGGVWNAYAGAATTYPFTHLNGFSAWFLSAPMTEPHLSESLANWYARDDSTWAFGLSARSWGMIGVLLLWTRVMFSLIRHRADDQSLRWAVRVLPLGFFLLSTQMHERYLFPAIALWAWSASATVRWWAAWIVLSLCAAANMIWVWAGPFTSIQSALWGNILGGSSGIMCALVLCIVACIAWFDAMDRREPSQANQAA